MHFFKSLPVTPGIVFVATLLGFTATAQADLMGANGQHIAGLAITLSMATGADTAVGTTTAQYRVALGNDPAADWTLLGFLVLREWSEGHLAEIGSPSGWSVNSYGPFVGWESFTKGSELGEGQTLAGFTYTYFGDPPERQFYHYVVSRDGGNPFWVVSRDTPLARPAAVMPEPTSVLLTAAPLVALMALRRRKECLSA
jgi:hypothetical protein